MALEVCDGDVLPTWLDVAEGLAVGDALGELDLDRDRLKVVVMVDCETVAKVEV